MQRDSSGQNGYVKLVSGSHVHASGYPERIYMRLHLSHPAYRSMVLTPEEARQLADELNRIADDVYFEARELMASPPERIASILERAPEIRQAVKRLRLRGYDWPAIEEAVLWSEAEGRLSELRVKHRTRLLTEHPEEYPEYPF